MQCKDFDTWNTKKKMLEKCDPVILYKQGSVWWCSLGINIGAEEDGKNEDFERPVLVIKILSKDTFLGVPLTSSGEDHFFRIPLLSFSKESRAVISQLRTISTKRLLREIGPVSNEDLFLVKKVIRKLLK